jgi:hypothetical protein
MEERQDTEASIPHDPGPGLAYRSTPVAFDPEADRIAREVFELPPARAPQPSPQTRNAEAPLGASAGVGGASREVPRGTRTSSEGGLERATPFSRPSFSWGPFSAGSERAAPAPQRRELGGAELLAFDRRVEMVSVALDRAAHAGKRMSCVLPAHSQEGWVESDENGRFTYCCTCDEHRRSLTSVRGKGYRKRREAQPTDLRSLAPAARCDGKSHPTSRSVVAAPSAERTNRSGGRTACANPLPTSPRANSSVRGACLHLRAEVRV